MAWFQTRRGHYRNVNGKTVWVNPSNVWLPDCNLEQQRLAIAQQRNELYERKVAHRIQLLGLLSFIAIHVVAFVAGSGLILHLWPIVTGLPADGRMVYVQSIAFPVGILFVLATNRFIKLFD